jgi:hypothetical protein
VFTALGLVPAHRHANAFDGGISWNYTTWLDIASLLLAAALLVRFSATGGWSMLRMMGGAPEGHQDHGDDADHTHHHAHEERP